MKSLVIILFVMVLFGKWSFCQSELYISPMPFVSSIMANGSMQGWNVDVKKSTQIRHIELNILNVSYLVNKRKGFSLIINRKDLSNFNYRINVRHLYSASDASTVLVKQNGLASNKYVPQVIAKYTRYKPLGNDGLYAGLGISLSGYYLSFNANRHYVVMINEELDYTGIGSPYRNIKVVDYTFKRYNYLNLALGPQFVFGWEYGSFRTELNLDLVSYLPEFYKVHKSVYYTSPTRNKQSDYAIWQMAVPNYFFGFTAYYKIYNFNKE
ncbi:hypothetical protein GC194_05620 [bacterium]|nr:hypothetical protein [bacterium]